MLKWSGASSQEALNLPVTFAPTLAFHSGGSRWGLSFCIFMQMEPHSHVRTQLRVTDIGRIEQNCGKASDIQK